MHQYFVIRRDKSFFVKRHSKSNNRYKQDKIIPMLDILIDNIFVLFGGWVFQQTIGIGTNCAPLLADLFLPTCLWARFPAWLLTSKDRILTQTSNSRFRYIDDILSLNNSRFGEYLHRIYPNYFEVKDTTDTETSASYLDLHFEIDNGGRSKTKLQNKRDDFTFPIDNFQLHPCMERTFISQLIHYVRMSAQYNYCLARALQLTQ
jgi:hypothetical protein